MRMFLSKSLGFLVLAALLTTTVQGEEDYDGVSFDVTNALNARLPALEEQNAALEEKFNSILAERTDEVLSGSSSDVSSCWADECGEHVVTMEDCMQMSSCCSLAIAKARPNHGSLLPEGGMAVQGNGCLVHVGCQSLLEGIHRGDWVLSVTKISH